ncbi:uncharacterized protein EV422DRAFT_535136 [Fimicolochytrium jonesii]|uniref:uncharacterized protein n=1 Tax=Fimicolochytrium jonesii TaxID=1396493 RepID=UPI0022FE210C|nr:uncharacterized protein EV422DRAFT_535136 [Fimicolochytrium jonesii]KAI8819105.1 hypothetical protein EV422DRAFT_535136 [Fimicolochytrium jonesii]
MPPYDEQAIVNKIIFEGPLSKDPERWTKWRTFLTNRAVQDWDIPLEGAEETEAVRLIRSIIEAQLEGRMTLLSAILRVCGVWDGIIVENQTMEEYVEDVDKSIASVESLKDIAVLTKLALIKSNSESFLRNMPSLSELTEMQNTFEDLHLRVQARKEPENINRDIVRKSTTGELVFFQSVFDWERWLALEEGQNLLDHFVARLNSGGNREVRDRHLLSFQRASDAAKVLKTINEAKYGAVAKALDDFFENLNVVLTLAQWDRPVPERRADDERVLAAAKGVRESLRYMCGPEWKALINVFI